MLVPLRGRRAPDVRRQGGHARRPGAGGPAGPRRVRRPVRRLPRGRLPGGRPAAGRPPRRTRAARSTRSVTRRSPSGRRPTTRTPRARRRPASTRACSGSRAPTRSPTRSAPAGRRCTRRRAVAYRARPTRPAERPAMAVLVQRQVDAEVSGRDVHAERAGPASTEIEASWGLGPSVVGGTVTPDAYRVAADGTVTRTVADKRTRVDRHGTRLVTQRGPRAATGGGRRSTTPPPIRLAELGQRVAAVLGGAQDVEWALVDGDLWVLQARPMTARPPGSVRRPRHPAATLVGTPGSRGTRDRHRAGRPRSRRLRPRAAGRHPRLPVDRPGLDAAAAPSWPASSPRPAGCSRTPRSSPASAASPPSSASPDATTTLRDSTTITIDGTAGTVTTTDG